FLFLTIHHPPRSTPFPYTTLFRSRVIGKGSKTRLVPVGRKACEALAAYLSGERPKLVGRRTGNEVFLSTRGTKMTTVRIWQIVRSEEHTSELQSLAYLVCRLLLEK